MIVLAVGLVEVEPPVGGIPRGEQCCWTSPGPTITAATNVGNVGVDVGDWFAPALTVFGNDDEWLVKPSHDGQWRLVEASEEERELLARGAYHKLLAD